MPSRHGQTDGWTDRQPLPAGAAAQGPGEQGKFKPQQSSKGRLQVSLRGVTEANIGDSLRIATSVFHVILP